MAILCFRTLFVSLFLPLQMNLIFNAFIFDHTCGVSKHVRFIFNHNSNCCNNVNIINTDTTLLFVLPSLCCLLTIYKYFQFFYFYFFHQCVCSSQLSFILYVREMFIPRTRFVQQLNFHVVQQVYKSIYLFSVFKYLDKFDFNNMLKRGFFFILKPRFKCFKIIQNILKINH